MRLVRQGKGLTQEQAGRLAGYSAATISRFETGARRLADVATLRHLAAVLEVSPEVFGLTAGHGGAAGGPAGTSLATVVASPAQDGDDVRRRELLAAVPAALLLPASRRPSSLSALAEAVHHAMDAGGLGGPQASGQLATAVRYCDLNFSRFPPAVLAAEVNRLRGTASAMLDQPQPDGTRWELRRTAGWLAALTGNLAFIWPTTRAR